MNQVEQELLRSANVMLTLRTRDGNIVTAHAHMFRDALKAWVQWHEQKEDEAIARMMHL